MVICLNKDRIKERSKFRILWHSVSSHIRCYDEKTEVLTREGWKYFKDVTFDDEILTLNPDTFVLEYQKPYGIYIGYHNGEMYRIRSKFVDLLVTPDHFFYIATKNRKGKWIWKFRQIKELDGVFKVPKTGKWIGVEQEYFILPGKVERKIRMEDWLKFMGWYLSEGYIDHAPINGNYTVAIRNREHKEEIFEVLQRVTPNKVFYMDEDKVAVRDKQLWEYLRQFGYSLDKYVPDYIKNLSPRLIRIFLDTFFKGDGIKKNPGFSTSSVRLRDDLQELVIKSGCASDYMKVKDIGSSGRYGTSNAINWRVSINTKYKYPQIRASRHITIEKYNGMIYCVTVPNHIIMVRRNGKAVFSGNSGYGIVTRYITSGLAKHGFSIFVSAYYGLEPGGVLVINGVPHFPSKNGRFGENSCLYYYKSLKANIACLMCYDDKTEVLTEDGWKLFRDLEPDDKVAQYNIKKKCLEFVEPIGYHQYPYEGLMFSIESPDISLLVTPNHKMYVKKKRDRRFSFDIAINIKDTSTFMKVAKWRSRKIQQRYLKELEKILEKEGYQSGSSRIIFTTDKKKADRIQEIAVKAGVPADINTSYSSSYKTKMYSVVLKTEKTVKASPNEYVSYNGYVYCVSVPSGAILVRRNGKIVICGNSDPWAFCYDDQTEVLTKDGFKFFKDLTLEDEVATLRDGEFLEYQKPVSIQEFSYSGKMLKISHSNQIDLLVTPNHKLYVEVPQDGYDKRAKKQFKLITAEELYFKSRARFKKDAKWHGRNPRYFVLPETDIKIDIKVWMEFLGYYFSEGYPSKHGVVISQVADKAKIEQINKCLQKMPFKYSKIKDGFLIYSKELSEYLKQYGTKSTNKFLPPEIKDLSSSLLKIFIDAYLVGDGSQNRVLYTSSKKLADDLQEVILKAGYATNLIIDDRVGRTTILNSKIITQRHKLYGVTIVTKQKQPLLFKKRGSSSRISRMEWVDYSGKVYCCTVPNHVIFVRRNGKTCWCGNSWFPTKLPMTMTYGPLDHINYPEEIRNLMRAYDFRVAPTYFQKREWESYDPPVKYDKVIYHGVDTSIYKPMNKKKAREILGLDKDIFLFGTVAANSDKESRKSWGEHLAAIRIFLDNNPDVKESHIKYFAYTNPADPRGLSLKMFVKKYNLEKVVILQNPMIFETGIKEDNLATIYNAMDIQLYCSRREGFGIPILEGMACGTPAIANDFSSMTELVSGRGWLVKPKMLVYTPIGAISSIVDPYDIAEMIERAYFKDRERERFSKKSIKFARRFDWNKLVREEWVPYFDYVMEQVQNKTSMLGITEEKNKLWEQIKNQSI